MAIMLCLKDEVVDTLFELASSSFGDYTALLQNFLNKVYNKQKIEPVGMSNGEGHLVVCGPNRDPEENHLIKYQ